LATEPKEFASNPRRKALRWLGLIGLGSGVAALGLGSLLKAPNFFIVPPKTLRVKVVYFQMSQYVSVGQEYFDVSSPASIGDLMEAVVQRHPSLSGMTSSMTTVVGGVPEASTDPLNDGEEVDLVPMMAGG